MVVSEHEIDEQQAAVEPITEALSNDIEQESPAIREAVEIQPEPQENDDTQHVQVACIPIVASISTDALYCGDTEPMAIVRVPQGRSPRSLILHAPQQEDMPYDAARSRQETAHTVALQIIHQQEAQFHHNILALAFFTAFILYLALFAMQHIVVR